MSENHIACVAFLDNLFHPIRFEMQHEVYCRQEQYVRRVSRPVVFHLSGPYLEHN